MRRRLLDRLGAPHTRRQALKSALAGAALTVPLGRHVAAAQGGGSNECQKGCNWTADRHFRNTQNICIQGHVDARYVIWYAPVVGILKAVRSARCVDASVVQHKADQFDCAQPGCSGFDPKAPGGPCDTCADNCCPCQASPNGYICCIFPCNDPDHNCCPGG